MHARTHTDTHTHERTSAHTHTQRGEKWDRETEKKQVCVWVVAGRSALIQEDEEEKWLSADGHLPDKGYFCRWQCGEKKSEAQTWMQTEKLLPVKLTVRIPLWLLLYDSFLPQSPWREFNLFHSCALTFLYYLALSFCRFRNKHFMVMLTVWVQSWSSIIHPVMPIFWSLGVCSGIWL